MAWLAIVEQDTRFTTAVATDQPAISSGKACKPSFVAKGGSCARSRNPDRTPPRARWRPGSCAERARPRRGSSRAACPSFEPAVAESAWIRIGDRVWEVSAEIMAGEVRERLCSAILLKEGSGIKPGTVHQDEHPPLPLRRGPRPRLYDEHNCMAATCFPADRASRRGHCTSTSRDGAQNQRSSRRGVANGLTSLHP